MYEQLSNISFGQTSSDLVESAARQIALNDQTPTSPSSFNNYSWQNHSYYQQQTSSPYNYYASAYHNYYANMVDNSATNYYSSTSESAYSSDLSYNSSLDSYYASTSASTSSNQIDNSITNPAPVATKNYYDSSLSSSGYNDSYSQISSPAPSSSAQSSLIESKEQEKVVTVESSKPAYDYSMKLSRKHQLPDRAVEIMNEWFDEHEHNPYPQQCEKEMIAQRGGITIKQVTAWFSNRRNRSQNSKPKRMQRVIKDNFSKICQEIAYNPDPNVVAEKVRLFQETLEKRY